MKQGWGSKNAKLRLEFKYMGKNRFFIDITTQKYMDGASP